MSVRASRLRKHITTRWPFREGEAGLGETRKCPMRSADGPPCSRPGTVMVHDRAMNVEYVCQGHGDEGRVLGWWV